MFIIEINYIVYISYVKETDVVFNVVYNVEKELKNVVLTLLTCIDYTDYIKDEETTISSLFSSLLTSTLTNKFDYIYVKSNILNTFIILSVISYRIYVISISIKS